MTAYCSSADFALLAGHLDLDVPDDVDALCERASRDLDAWLCWPPPLLTAGLRIDVTLLTAFQVDCLVRATVAQSAYRLVVDEEAMIEGAPKVTGVTGGLTFSPTAPDLISRAALTLLAGASLLNYRTGTASPPPPDVVPLDVGW